MFGCLNIMKLQVSHEDRERQKTRCWLFSIDGVIISMCQLECIGAEECPIGAAYWNCSGSLLLSTKAIQMLTCSVLRLLAKMTQLTAQQIFILPHWERCQSTVHT